MLLSCPVPTVDGPPLTSLLTCNVYFEIAEQAMGKSKGKTKLSLGEKIKQEKQLQKYHILMV